jgi:hypothetical protein
MVFFLKEREKKLIIYILLGSILSCLGNPILAYIHFIVPQRTPCATKDFLP